MSLRTGFPTALLALTLLSPGTARPQTSIELRTTGPDYLQPNAPFTLARTTRTEMKLQNGSIVAHEQTEKLTRNAAGQLFDLSQPVSTDGLTQASQFYMLADPTTHTITNWRQGQSTAASFQLPPGAKLDVHVLWTDPFKGSRLPATAKATTEELGKEQIAGLEATGTRTTTELPANAFGNPTALHIVHEVWTSTALGIPLRQLDNNPFTGTRTMNTEKADQTAGGAALFHLPAGLVVKPIPVGGVAPSRDAATLAYQNAEREVQAPESREAAADTIVAYAGNHPELANHIAHILAVYKTHLPDAKRLAETSIERLEDATSHLTLADMTPSADEEMFNLAEYWDSLGSVYAAVGDNPTALRYFRTAWELGGEGLYLDHCAQLEVAAGDKAAALKDISVALSGKMDARETDYATRRAQRLGVAEPKPSPDPTVLDIPGTASLQGSAHFVLLFEGSGKPAVQLTGGDEALRTAAKPIASVTFPTQTPDSGPEHILRAADLNCVAGTGCKLHLLYAWQAKDEALASVRETLTAPPASPKPGK